MITRLITSLSLSFLAISLVPHQASAAATIGAESYVNLKSDVDDQVSRDLFTSVSSSASTPYSMASSEATWDLKFKTFASSKGEGLSYPANALAFFLGTFSLNDWEEDYPLPINLNFKFTGSLEATSSLFMPGSLGFAYLSLLVETTDSIWSDSMVIHSQGGIPVRASGAFEAYQPTFSIRPYVDYLNIKYSLTPQYLIEIGLSPYYNDWSSIDFVDLRLKIAEAIYELGLEGGPYPYIPKFTEISWENVGVDIGIAFDGMFNLSLYLEDSDALFIVMQSTGQTTPGATGASDFRNTLGLESITIPADFELPPGSEPYIQFDSGLVVPVTKVQTVPEPPTILGSATALGFGAFFKRKLKTSKSTEKDTTKVG